MSSIKANASEASVAFGLVGVFCDLKLGSRVCWNWAGGVTGLWGGCVCARAIVVGCVVWGSVCLLGRLVLGLFLPCLCARIGNSFGCVNRIRFLSGLVHLV